MKIQVPKFVKVLKTITMGWEVPVVQLNFESDGIKVIQCDSSMTNAIIATIYPKFILDYKPIGKLKITKKQVDMIADMFKVDDYVDFSVEGDKMVFKGREEELELLITDEDVNVLSNVELTKKPYGEVLAKPKILRAFQVDLGSLRDIGYERTLKFVFSDKLQAVVISEAFKYVKTIPVFKSDGSDSGEAAVSSDLVEEIAEINDKGWIVFTEEPVEIYYECEDYKVLFVLSQVVL